MNDTQSTAFDTEISRLRGQMRQMRLMTGLLGLALVAVVASGAIRPFATTDVLRAERLEIVEPDGTLAFVLANSAHPQAATMDGVQLLEGQEEERRMPSFTFFDGKGDEVGGMAFRNEVSENGYSAMRHLSLDGFKQDQTVVLHHYQDPRGTRAGLSISDRPEGSLAEGLRSLGIDLPASRADLEAAVMTLPEEERQARLTEIFGGAPRAFVGRALDRSSTLVLSDGQGRPRIVLGVPYEGEPFIRILDEDGNPLVNWPER